MAGEKTLRILSLLPAATEIVYSLGLEKYLVGGYSGRRVFHIKEGLLRKLRPNLILTQDLCEVCAVGFNQVKKAARALKSSNQELRIISLEPQSVEDILQNILTVGKATGSRQQAQKVVINLKKRIENCKLQVENFTKPKVCVVEWLDPLMIAGHWVPEMVGLAGGENLIAKPGQKSKILTLHQIVASKPDILIISPCAFDIDRTIIEKELISKIGNALGEAARIVIVDGNSYMTRPGPRIVDGIEILAEILHPDIFPRKYTKKDWVEFK
ncbi:MAG: iron complex transport system substrate-binding protein [Microgenomates group bacterium Gr01-1014_7]|nr:MAG: iron complex transport system substrate-binding protein [Microgenomates group bacterium Gr01-1014_7]